MAECVRIGANNLINLGRDRAETNVQPCPKNAATLPEKKQQRTDSIFAGRTFYLDIRRNPALRSSLESGIKALNGVIKEFLENSVKYVVTDKPVEEWPEEAQARQRDRQRRIEANQQALQQGILPQSLSKTTSDQGRGDGLAATTSSVQAPSYSAVVQQHLDTTTQPQVDMFSRGKLLLMAAGAQPAPANHVPEMTAQQVLNKTPYKAGMTDVVELACQRGMKLVRASEMLHFIQQRLLLAQQQLKQETEASSIKSQKVVPLDPPFVKFDENDKRHRPTYKILREWPTLTFDSDPSISPFCAPQQRVALAAAAEKKNQKQYNQKEQQEKEVRIIRKPSMPKKRQPQFCEICQIEFHSIQEHIHTAAHEAFARNCENWKEVTSVLQSIPSLNDIIADAEDGLSQSSSQNSYSGFNALSPSSNTHTISIASVTSHRKIKRDSGFIPLFPNDNNESSHLIRGKEMSSEF